jgi:DNA/RNA endonuclease YhcR with UshA esterase domain
LVEDKDVVAERRRMQAPNGVSDVIQIQGLRKVYPASSGLKVRQLDDGTLHSISIMHSRA